MVTDEVVPLDFAVCIDGAQGLIWIRACVDEYTRMITRYELCWNPGGVDSPPDENRWHIPAESSVGSFESMSIARLDQEMRHAIRGWNSLPRAHR